MREQKRLIQTESKREREKKKYLKEKERKKERKKKNELPAQLLSFFDEFFVSFNFGPDLKFGFQTFRQTLVKALLLEATGWGHRVFAFSWGFGAWIKKVMGHS